LRKDEDAKGMRRGRKGEGVSSLASMSSSKWNL